MAIAIALLVIALGSVLFHVFTPWWTTPIASNWQSMDDTLQITLVVTGVFFVAINLFVVYTLWRFRHREGQTRRAAYEPENKRLERWLIGITTVGIIGLLAPGLVVYAAYVRPPDDALTLEVVGTQWQWRFRLAGVDGKLGRSDARFVSGTNPLGIDPRDADAQGNVIVLGNEVHLPLNRPVKVVMRSLDVLHDFYVPPFRARMNIVPGQLSSFWFTPTEAGRYESMCAQLCGVGHANMRGYVVVEDEADFVAWVKTQPTFAQTQKPAAPAGGTDTLAARGQAPAQSNGWVACHSGDGRAGVGPPCQGRVGKTEQLDDGGTVQVDDEFLRGFIRDPKARSIKGFPAVMPVVPMSDEELSALVAHIKALGAAK